MIEFSEAQLVNLNEPDRRVICSPRSGCVATVLSWEWLGEGPACCAGFTKSSLPPGGHLTGSWPELHILRRVQRHAFTRCSLRHSRQVGKQMDTCLQGYCPLQCLCVQPQPVMWTLGAQRSRIFYHCDSVWFDSVCKHWQTDLIMFLHRLSSKRSVSSHLFSFLCFLFNMGYFLIKTDYLILKEKY